MITITLTYPDAVTAALDLAKLASKADAIRLNLNNDEPAAPVDIEALSVPTPAAKAQTAKAIEKAAKVEVPKPAKAEAPPAPTPTATETATATLPVAPAPSEPVAESPSEITYDKVYEAITKLAQTDKNRVIAALAKFGAKRGPELKAEQYADFLAELA